MKVKLSLLAVLLLTVPASAFQAGASKRDVTPSLDRPVFIAGFGHNRIATSVHDPIWVRCLAISDGKSTVALVGIDVIGFFYEPDVLSVRERVGQLTKKPVTVVIASTHNHEGPDTLGLWGPMPLQTGRDEKYMAWLKEEIAQCVIDAVSRLEPARFIIAKDERKELSDLQLDTRLPHVKDHAVYVLQAVSRKTGKTIGTLVNWANHPEVLGSKNREITSDFCWALYERLEELVGGVAVFWNGAIGGLITPLDEEVKVIDPQIGQPAPEASFRKAELIGKFVAEVAAEALKSKNATKVDNGSLKVLLRPLFVPLQNTRFRIAAAIGVLKRPVYTKGKIDERLETVELKQDGTIIKAKMVAGEDIRTEVGVIAIYSREQKNPMALLLLIPGEIYPELVYGNITRYQGADFMDAPFEPILMDYARKTGARFVFVVGLANDEIGYIIPQCEWDEQPPWLNNATQRPYGEVNSVGWKAARIVNEGLVALIKTLMR
ncbi:MAG: hypothetical protein NZ805_01625 [Armatimonadetes bacterium]|nr:hypothetical protein [Armatimonadota bacterium]MDW8027563.1 hypothetical protein [Armatimonadota bacterium]